MLSAEAMFDSLSEYGLRESFEIVKPRRSSSPTNAALSYRK